MPVTRDILDSSSTSSFLNLIASSRVHFFYSSALQNFCDEEVLSDLTPTPCPFCSCTYSTPEAKRERFFFALLMIYYLRYHYSIPNRDGWTQCRLHKSEPLEHKFQSRDFFFALFMIYYDTQTIPLIHSKCATVLPVYRHRPLRLDNSLADIEKFLSL